MFSFGTFLTTVTVVWIMIEIQLFNRERLFEKGAHNVWQIINHAALLPGMVAAYCTYMVGQTPWDVDGYMHGTYAITIFRLGIMWCVMAWFVSARIHWGSPTFRKILLARGIPAVAAIVGLWQMLSNQASVWTDDFDWENYVEGIEKVDEKRLVELEKLIEKKLVTKNKKNLIIPGIVDMKAFVGEPGFEYKENFRTLSQAALAGGVTSIVTMPNTKPIIDNVSMVDFIIRRGRDKSAVNLFPCASITKPVSYTHLTLPTKA